MNYAFVLNAILLIYIFAGTVFFFSHRKQSRSARTFSIVCVGASIWALGQFLIMVVVENYPNETAFFWVNKLTYLGMVILPPAAIFASLVYCGKYTLYTNKKLVYGMITLSALFFIIILTDPYHHLYYGSFAISKRTYAPVWYAFTLYAYACFVLSCVQIVVHHRKRRPKAIKFFLLLFLPPIVSNTLDIFIKDTRFDLTVVSVALMITAALLLVFRFRAVNISPIAAKKILTELVYPVYLLSPAGDVLFVNTAAQRNADVMESYRCEKRETIMSKEGRIYKPKPTPLPDGNTMFAFLDITHYAKMLSELERQNAELMRLQMELEVQMKAVREYAEVVQEYAAQRSRQEVMVKLGDRVHDIINRLLENTRVALAQQTPDVETIEKNITLAQDGVKTVRTIIDEIKGERWDEL